MNRPALCSLLLATMVCCTLPTFAQQQTSNSVIVPRLIRFGGVLKDSSGKPLQGTAGITFALYQNQAGGAALWVETQNVSLDSSGRYSVLLGATKEEGVPMDLFTSGAAQWLGIQAQGQPEQPRVLLVSVPYALKAADAETLGGLPPSAFAPALKTNSTTSTTNTIATAVATTGAVTTLAPTGSGTTNFVPLWTSSSNLSSSTVSQVGGNVGIGFGSPLPGSFGAKLDVKGSGVFRGPLTLPATGTATASVGKTSQALNFVASVFNSAAATPVAQNFRWQAEPAGNNTAGASGTLNLLFGQGINAPAETGLKISRNGRIIFAPGQSFPPAPGIVRSVGLSAPLSDFTVSGSPITGSGTLALKWTVVPTTQTVANSIVKRDSTGSFSAFGITTAQVFGDATVSGSGFCCGVVGIGVFRGGDFASPSPGGLGVRGMADNSGIGVYGAAGTLNTGGQGVVGESFGTTSQNGFGPDGVDGFSHNAAGSGVAGLHDAGGAAIFGQVTNGGLAGDFFGDVAVSGHLSKTSGSFKIDHPLDPANKYLYHSFVESPDMMNIYNGNVITDTNGLAVVQLPEWFEALNRDFRYQLTVIGQFAEAIVASKIANRRFTIKTDKPSVEVSWQVTGIRQDAWANAHRIPVEEAKPPRERGYYLHPELFGAPIEKSVVGLRHPSVVSFAKRVSTQVGNRATQESPYVKKLKVAQDNAAKN